MTLLLDHSSLFMSLSVETLPLSVSLKWRLTEIITDDNQSFNQRKNRRYYNPCMISSPLKYSHFRHSATMHNAAVSGKLEWSEYTCFLLLRENMWLCWRTLILIHYYIASVSAVNILCSWPVPVSGFIFNHQLIHVKYTAMEEKLSARSYIILNGMGWKISLVFNSQCDTYLCVHV